MLPIHSKQSLQDVSESQRTTGCECFCNAFEQSARKRNTAWSEKEAIETEKLVADELMRMSLEERERVTYDLHGITTDVGMEDSAMLENCYQELEQLLLSHTCPNHNKKHQCAHPEFRLAWESSPSYVRSLYVMFLRASEYNTKESAKRILNHFQFKCELFGKQTLVRDITLDDLSKADISVLETGAFQLLPVRDRAGRVTFVNVSYAQDYKEAASMWRYLWYLNMVMCHDEETQKLGCTVVAYMVGHGMFENFDKELYMGLYRVKMCTPIRVNAIHYCFSGAGTSHVMSFVTNLLDQHARTRVKMHEGTHMETQYDLLTFGIQIKSLPITGTGKIKTKDHLDFLRKRRLQEKKLSSVDEKQSATADIYSRPKVIVIPSHNDVIFGRGSGSNLHIGNIRLGGMIEEELKEYSKMKRNEKSVVHQRLFDKIQLLGGRFLKQDKDGLWEEVSKRTALDKVAHRFRNCKPYAGRKAQILNSLSSSANNKVPPPPPPNSAASKGISPRKPSEKRLPMKKNPIVRPSKKSVNIKSATSTKEVSAPAETKSNVPEAVSPSNGPVSCNVSHGHFPWMKNESTKTEEKIVKENENVSESHHSTDQSAGSISIQKDPTLSTHLPKEQEQQACECDTPNTGITELEEWTRTLSTLSTGLSSVAVEGFEMDDEIHAPISGFSFD